MYDMKNGEGRYIFKNGDIYEGKWVNNMRHGEGRIITPKGDVKEG